jgi:hypothetical protein
LAIILICWWTTPSAAFPFGQCMSDPTAPEHDAKKPVRKVACVVRNVVTGSLVVDSLVWREDQHIDSFTNT